VAEAARAAASPRVVAASGLGAVLFFGRGGCTACHRLGDVGAAEVGPNLGAGPGFAEPLARRARAGGDAFGYALRSIVDPDALLVPSYPGGKMPRVEEPPIALDDRSVAALAAFLALRGAGPEAPVLTDARLEGAPAEIARMRAVRTRRVAEKRMEQLSAQVRWDAVRPEEGPRVSVASGCGGCHGPPERMSLRVPGVRPSVADALALRRSALAWLAERLPRRQACAELVRPQDLGDLAAWLATARPAAAP
jgi:mono/diheme cytochrome c family protein